MGRKYKHYKDEVLRSEDNNTKFFNYVMILLLVVVIIQLFLLNSKISNLDLIPVKDSVGGTVKAAPAGNDNTVNSVKSIVDDDSIKGDVNAPVTIVEFSDYECPYCARFYRETLGQIDEKYIKTGKVKLIYRDFPLGFHKDAQKAAEAAECAGEQGKYYEMHNLLFDKGVSGGSSSFKSYASEIGLDREEFDSCLDSGKMASEISKDVKDGQALGVRGTPAFFINGKMISGAQPFAVFDAEIQAALN